MIRVGVDVGGTFTDIVVFDEDRRIIAIHKVPTTPKRPVRGILNGLTKAVGDPSRIGVLVHATTIGTNMFLGQMGIEPPMAVLFTNDGFRDVLEIGRQNRPSLYNVFYKRPEPLIPRQRRIGIRGRINSRGRELEPLDTDTLRIEVLKWCGKGVRVFIVSFLHSYINPAHEALAKKVIEEACPGSIVVLSHEVDPQPMEYERTSTTVVNGLLKPVLSRYLYELEQELKSLGFKGSLLVMQSSGGVAGIREALEKPAAFIESGPSAGAVAVAYLSKLLGVSNALGFDMGGTTAKASSIVDGEPEVVDVYEVGGTVHMGRLVRGSGYPVRFPHIDLAEVSAGGGTIAWIDPGGGLRVGPISAGADPGPVCYGKGGSEPTVTDANLLLGRLPGVIAGGMKLNVGLAEEAIREKIARPLGIDVVEAAWTIIGLANTIMARALRLVSIERGHDPRTFTLFAFGGAGPLHAVEIAEEINVSRIIIPPYAGVFSALGLLVADYKHSFHTAVVKPLDQISEKELEALYQSLERKASKLLDTEGVPPDKRRFIRYVEAKYWGQAYTLRLPYRDNLEKLIEEFHELHIARYGFSNPKERIEVVVVRLEAYGLTSKPVLRAVPEEGDAVIGERDVFYRNGWYKATVYSRERLGANAKVEGPAVIEARDTTVVLPPGYTGNVDEFGNIIVER
ncbi:MAG: hydantoinase/oxoprolinase family protein [Desulfurococcales archaeon]|nr:hydantoinase/oxoprolinase family protein [Desulfurococcales archaeon]